MPLYMDVHILPGVTAKEVARAHNKDLMHQEEYGCRCMTYWIDEIRENVFCLIDAPDREAVKALHRRSHGLIPNKIIEVDRTVVNSFLGRIYDPEADLNSEGLKVFSDSSFRILLVTNCTDPCLLRHRFGKEKADELVNSHNCIIRKILRQHGGTEAEQEGCNFIISFSSAARAISCATAIRQEMQEHHADAFRFTIAINAGEPLEKSNQLFGDTIQLANSLCFIAGNFEIVISSAVKELVSKELLQNQNKNFLTLPPQDENLLLLLFGILEQNWQDAGFDISSYCHETAMSVSQLYRKTISLTGLSPNSLLKNFRLEKAKGLMKKQRYSIAQITFDSGFTSPSYFTKCFKKKYGMLPMAYLDLLH